MSEYIIEWSGIGARIVELIGSETPCLVVKRLRKERLREPIVRCRDCIGLYETWDGWECERFSGEYHRAEPDGFCSWSCRRSDKE